MLPVTALFVAALPSTASSQASLNPHTARHALVQKLAAGYGGEFTGATAVWVQCPREEILNFSGNITALCLAEFGRHRTRRLVVADVDSRLHATVDFSRRWLRRFRRCRSGALHRLGFRGSVSTNDGSCTSAVLMAMDVAFALRRGHFTRHPIAFHHGTNMAGFDRYARYPCVKKRRGHKVKITCRNALGDAFRYRTSLSRLRHQHRHHYRYWHDCPGRLVTHRVHCSKGNKIRHKLLVVSQTGQTTVFGYHCQIKYAKYRRTGHGPVFCAKGRHRVAFPLGG